MDKKRLDNYDKVYKFLQNQNKEISIIRLQMGVEIDLIQLNEVIKIMSKDGSLKNGTDLERIFLNK